MQVISVAMYMLVTYFFERIQISNVISQAVISFWRSCHSSFLEGRKKQPLCFTITIRKIKNEAYQEIIEFIIFLYALGFDSNEWKQNITPWLAAFVGK